MTPAALLPALRGLKVGPTTFLPDDVLHAIFRHLQDPLDLYQASLVSHAWRRVATEDRLWEVHFWDFFRPVNTLAVDAEEYAALQQRRKRYERAAILSWLPQAASSPPSTELFEQRSSLVKDIAGGGCTSIVAGALPFVEGQKLALPPFLSTLADKTNDSAYKLPGFCHLFARQMNSDDALLRELRTYADSTIDLVNNLMTLLSNQRWGSRYLLAAICATQRPTSDNIDIFLEGQSKEDSNAWPRALQLHALAKEGKTLPQREYSLSLYHLASKGLGHLQRRDAIYAIQNLQERKSSFEKPASSGFRDWVTTCSVGLEEAAESLALFRGGERFQVREYLDLLALYVFSDLQAQDHRAAASEKSYALQADEGSYPLGSTRYYMARIVAALNALGFTTAASSDSQDLDNSFLNVVLFCPAQRPTLPLTLATIICAVARRLGIAAAISKASGRTLIIAVEDEDQPTSWSTREWRHFFVDPASPADKSIHEGDEVSRLFGASGLAKSEQAALLEPASPQHVLARVAADLRASGEAQRGRVERFSGRERYPGEDEAILQSASPHQLGRLRLYLEGRQPHPPAPLPRATFASSLAMLPSTAVHGTRASPKRRAIDAEYCSDWLSRLVAPQQLGGLDDASVAVASMIADFTSMFACDFILLIQVDHWTKPKGEKRVQPSRGQGEGGAPSIADLPPAPRYFTEYICELLQFDNERGVGLGCIGGAEPEERQNKSGAALPRRLVDRSYPSNSHVKFGVGTVVRNIALGSCGVVLGWDSECRRCEGYIAQHGVDDLPSGGRFQAFYLVIAENEAEGYMPQCLLEALCIPAHSTHEVAARALRRLVPLLSEARILGKAFRTLRVEPWDVDGGKGTKNGAGKRKSGLKKQEGKEGKEKQNARKPGQVYLVQNAWMKEAWPYD